MNLIWGGVEAGEKKWRKVGEASPVKERGRLNVRQLPGRRPIKQETLSPQEGTVKPDYKIRRQLGWNNQVRTCLGSKHSPEIWGQRRGTYKNSTKT